jgi:hypothetical protein
MCDILFKSAAFKQKIGILKWTVLIFLKKKIAIKIALKICENINVETVPTFNFFKDLTVVLQVFEGV